VLFQDVATDYLHNGFRPGRAVWNFKNSTGLYARAQPVYSTRRQPEFKVIRAVIAAVIPAVAPARLPLTA